MNLITGATGFVGAHLTLHLLENGQSVRALYRHESKKDFTRKLFSLYGKEHLYPKIEWHKADLCDIPALEPAFENVLKVYHCAALVSFDPRDEPAMRKANIEGTANMVNLSLAFGVEKFLHLSSIAALGDPISPETIVDETTEWNPEKEHSDYAISKYGAEMEVWRARQEGLSVLIVAPAVILGPIPDLEKSGQGSAQIFKEIKKEFPFYTNASNGFISVTDVVRLMNELMESGISNERFIAVAEHHNMHWISKKVAAAYRVKAPFIEAGPKLLRAALLFDRFLSVFGKKRKLFSDSIPALLSKSRFSDAKLQSALKTEYTDISTYIEECVRIMDSKPTTL
ncbi:NAD-dependent epimerase/dehydratase family protein [Flavobacterium silvaticum]|uniref:NAD-dependent epimerase/dehydratase family protein n=1 Tax=Flavobacterium silvaticum TaxID=1852020 RepID=A0A972FVU1_9FLAO|nr:NAD-dependent epimerase/dehydratase family protein [Flavobacterium silvaticum]NMH28550.1 NAD-dependent epimerase/dehydratase family protein [Flavobacterium silvaticum]